MKTILLGLLLVGVCFWLAVVHQATQSIEHKLDSILVPTQAVTPAPPLYGGCEEWRPAYGPKPKECR